MKQELVPSSKLQKPQSVLYATSAGLGGSGLNTTSLEGVLASYREGILSKAICYSVKQREIPASLIQSLQLHPVRFTSFVGSQSYYAAKKLYVDWYASLQLKRGKYDLFHGWTGECFKSLVEAKLQGIPSVMDVPTWHRNKGILKPTETRHERLLRLNLQMTWRDRLRISRQQNLLEYDLVNVLFMPSRKSTETFLSAGIAEERLHYVGRGVDVERYRPAEQPPTMFRVVFVGALIKRKGVHLLLEAWHRLNLANAELVLVGSVHPEIQEDLKRFKGDSVRVLGSIANVQDVLHEGSVFAFPSECEGFAKATLEAAACALPLIATRESGDAIVPNVTGLEIPANDLQALVDALIYAYEHPDEMRQMGLQARQLVEERFTWNHYRQRILEGYQKAIQLQKLA